MMQQTPYNLTVLCSILLIFTVLFALLPIFSYMRNNRANSPPSVEAPGVEATGVEQAIPVGQQESNPSSIVKSQMTAVYGQLINHQLLLALIPSTVLASVLIYYANILLKMKTNDSTKNDLAKASIAISSIVLFINFVLFMIFGFSTMSFKIGERFNLETLRIFRRKGKGESSIQ